MSAAEEPAAQRPARRQIDPTTARLVVIGRKLLMPDGRGEPRDFLAQVDHDVGEMGVGARQRRHQQAREH